MVGSKINNFAKFLFKIGAVCTVAPSLGTGVGITMNTVQLNNSYALKNYPIERIVKKWNVDEVVKKYEALDVKNFEIVDFLNLSYFTVLTHLYYLLNKESEQSFNIDYSLSSGVGVCDEFAYFTSAVYNYLVKEAGKPELSSRVRINLGIVEVDGKNSGHSWLEYNKGGVWQIYETTRIRHLNINMFDNLGKGIGTKKELSDIVSGTDCSLNKYVAFSRIIFSDRRYHASVTLNAFNPWTAYTLLAMYISHDDNN